MINFDMVVGGLNELGKARFNELLNVPNRVQLHHMQPAEIAAITPEMVPGSIVELAATDLFVVDQLGNVTEAVSSAFTETAKVCARNKALAVVGLIGVGVLGFYVWTKFCEQNQKINRLQNEIADMKTVVIR